MEGNASLNWMDIDHIGGLLSTQGAGGVRQVGRYLLISRASNLISTIQAKCTQALKGMDGPNLDVYIFAGLSGGTGSGCFLDTCYIVQKALEDMGMAQFANVMGFFFLPDVITQQAPGGLAARCGQVLQQQRIRGHEGAGLSDEPEGCG
ncbi:MAG: tubulin-like doman-containing protein [Oscillospiraceae bacterium]